MKINIYHNDKCNLINSTNNQTNLEKTKLRLLSIQFLPNFEYFDNRISDTPYIKKGVNKSTSNSDIRLFLSVLEMIHITLNANNRVQTYNYNVP